MPLYIDYGPTALGTPAANPAGAQIAFTLGSSAATYSAGTAIGGLTTLATAARIANGTGIIQSLAIIDSSNQKAAIDFIFLNAAPTNTPVDHSAWTLTATDFGKQIGRYSLLAAAYASYGTAALGNANGLGIGFQTVGGQTIYVVAICQGTPTYTASCLNVMLSLEPRD
jgi:hypothetical protein